MPLSIRPGQTAFTRMSRAAYVIAAERVSPATPCLDAVYGALGPPRCAYTEPLLTMRPPPACASIMRISAFMQYQVPVRLTLIEASQSWSSHSANSTGSTPTPALLNAASSRPYWRAMKSKSCLTLCASAMSTCQASAWPLASRICVTVRCAASRSMSALTTA